MQTGVAGQRTGKQPGLAQDLKSVANTQYRETLRRGTDDLTHHGRELRDRTGPQIVAVGEASGHHHGVHLLEVGVGVPETHGLRTGEPDRPCRVDVVERAGKVITPTRAVTPVPAGSRLTLQSSMTVLANSDSAISASVSSSMLSSTSSSNRLPCRTSETAPKPRRPSAPTIACPWGRGSRPSASHALPPLPRRPLYLRVLPGRLTGTIRCTHRTAGPPSRRTPARPARLTRARAAAASTTWPIRRRCCWTRGRTGTGAPPVDRGH